eukprot:scaffold11654_cov22-Tisochrysis_lutea.AAC.1
MAARSPLPSSQASQVILPSTPPPTTTNQRQYDSTNGRITILTVKQIQLLLRALQLASRPVRFSLQLARTRVRVASPAAQISR